MVGTLLLVIMIAPAIAAIGCMLVHAPPASPRGLNLAASLVVFAAAIPLTVLSANGPYHYLGEYVVVDMTGAWVILCTAIVYLLASIYSIGYMRLLDEDDRLWGFYALFSGFALTILLSTVMNNAGLYWIAIELTTLVSTFLVGFERAAESVEAAWKYIIIVSAGISLALLGTVLFYWCGSFVLGPSYDMTWDTLRAAAPKMNPALVSLAYLLVLVGYGTKVGLAPMHTWLPDAHSESPAPISAMLSGALLNGAMLGIVRYLTIADAAQNAHLARTVARGLWRFLASGRRTLHRSPERHQAAHGLFERRAYGRACAWFRLRRTARHRRRALSHAQSLAEQVADVLWRRQCDAQLWLEGNP